MGLNPSINGWKKAHGWKTREFTTMFYFIEKIRSMRWIINIFHYRFACSLQFFSQNQSSRLILVVEETGMWFNKRSFSWIVLKFFLLAAYGTMENERYNLYKSTMNVVVRHRFPSRSLSFYQNAAISSPPCRARIEQMFPRTGSFPSFHKELDAK